MANVIHLTAENFEEVVLKADKKVLVDFFADWCGPCRMVAPILEEIATEQEDVIIAKINVDEALDIAQTYGVMSIPTMIVFQDGEILEKSVGALPKNAILNLIG